MLLLLVFVGYADLSRTARTDPPGAPPRGNFGWESWYHYPGGVVNTANENLHPLLPLVTDPLLHATFLGGNGLDWGSSITLDSSGSVFVTGVTGSVDFRPTPRGLGAQDGLGDVFVLKLDAAGAVIYATYFGGGGEDEALSIAVDSAGNAYVAGRTSSIDFPTTQDAFDASLNGTSDGFVAKLDPAGGGLVYSTYLGGGDEDAARAVDVDAAGNAYVTGQTSSPDFPMVGSFDSSFNGATDAFLVKLTPAGDELVYSTYLGGDGDDQSFGMAMDAGGAVYLTGSTESTDFPVSPGALDASLDGLPPGPPGQPSPPILSDAFVAKLDRSGSLLLYSTYLGQGGEDVGFSIAVDSTGNAYVTGRTSSLFLWTPDAYDTSFNGLFDAFVAKLNATGEVLLYATYLGGSDFDFSRALALDANGAVYITGITQSADFPVTLAAFDTLYNDDGSALISGDAFVARLGPAGETLVYSSFLGGSALDSGHSIAVNSEGHAFVTGTTASVDFPTSGEAIVMAFRGETDAFVARLDTNSMVLPTPLPWWIWWIVVPGGIALAATTYLVFFMVRRRSRFM